MGSADAPHVPFLTPTFEAGSRIRDLVIQRCVQIREDIEVYYVTHRQDEPAALKILRTGSRPSAHDALAREAVILRHLDGRSNPALWAAGAQGTRPYLVLQWCAGVPVLAAAAALRAQGAPPAQRALLTLCLALLDAYAHLHAQQIIHAHIHPRHIYASPDGTIRILDYGLARRADLTEAEGIAPRGGTPFFFEPEYAAARGRGGLLPAASMLGEQYALAALVYLLLTGTYYLDFSRDQAVRLRQITEDGPRPFSQRGWSPWPAVEAVLDRALRKDPAARFPSVAAFAAQLRAATAPAGGAWTPH